MSEVTVPEASRIPWRAGRVLTPSPWGSASVHSSARLLHCLSTPGDLAPDAAEPAWLFRLGLPEDRAEGICWLADGLLLADSRGTRHADAVVHYIAPGILIGRLRGMAPPSLSSSLAVPDIAGDTQRLALPGEHICLQMESRGNYLHFCLAWAGRTAEEVQTLARDQVRGDAAESLGKEMLHREAFWALAVDPASAQGLARALESFLQHLRPPSEELTGPWYVSQIADDGPCDLNALYPVISVLCRLDPALAAALLTGLLVHQAMDGGFPSLIDPRQGAVAERHPYPLLAQCVQLVWRFTHDASWLRAILPRLAAYLRNALVYHDPDHSGILRWTSAEEALLSDTYDQGLAPADLTAMILAEIDALKELNRAAPLEEVDSREWSGDRTSLADMMESFFWESSSLAYKDRYPGGDHISRLTLSSVLPLLWRDLPQARCESLLKHLKNPHVLRLPHAVGLWVHWSEDAVPPPAPPLHQILVVEALDRHHATLEWELLARNLRHVLWPKLEADQFLPSDLAQPDKSADPATANQLIPLALALLVGSRPVELTEADRAVAGWLQWLDRHRMVSSILLVLLMTLCLSAVLLASCRKEKPTVQAMETTMGLARRYYSEHRYDEALALLDNMKGEARNLLAVDLHRGVALYRQGRYEEAAVSFAESMARRPEVPAGAMNRGLALFQLGRYDEAQQAYTMVATQFATSAPELAGRAQLALQLIENHKAQWEKARSMSGRPKAAGDKR